MPYRQQRAQAVCAAALMALACIMPCCSAFRSCNSQALFAGPWGETAVHNLTLFRSRVLPDVLALNFSTTLGQSGAAAWGHYDFAKPFISCPPYRSPIVRYGNSGDGGKLLCNLTALTAPCVIYSLGSNGDYTFENDMLAATPCEVHTFDCTYAAGTSVLPGRHFFHKVCVGSGEFKGVRLQSLQNITSELGHSSIDVMKIDIEGHEMAVLSSLTPFQHLPAQLVVEFHLYQAPGMGISPTAPKDTAQLGLLILHLANLGYGITADEANIWGNRGCCTELSFLRVEAQRVRLSKQFLHQ